MRTVTMKYATKNPKRFILKHLIPAILREHGRAFAMQCWHWNFGTTDRKRINSGVIELDEIARRAPICGSVSCIGGTIGKLISDAPQNSTAAFASTLGLNYDQAHGLFYGWESTCNYGWPEVYRRRYRSAKTPLQKAKVACSLLTQIAKNGGTILERP